MSVRQHRTFPFEQRSTKPDGSSFEGHCAVFNSIDEYGTIMGKGCFGKRLGRFLERGFVGGLNHNWDEPIGSPKTAREDDMGLFVSADVLDTAHGMDVRKLLASKVCKYLSFGFDVMGKAYLEKPEDCMAYWSGAGYAPTDEDLARSKYGAVLYNDIEVYEFSPVMVPGNQNAAITSVREGVRASLPLDDHLVTAREAVGEICERLTQLATLRAGSGRHLPPERTVALRQMRDTIDLALAACQPRAGADEVLKLRREMLEFDFSLLPSIGV